MNLPPRYLASCLVALLLGVYIPSSAQLCIVDGVVPAPSDLARDTLADINFGIPASQTFQIAREGTFTYQGFSITKGNLEINQLLMVPSWLQVICHVPQSNCITDPDSAGDLRFCLQFDVISTVATNPAYPGYDSFLVKTMEFLNIPIMNPYLYDTIWFYYRSSGVTATSPSTSTATLEVHPQPAAQYLQVEAELENAGEGTLALRDATGRVCWVREQGWMEMGGHQITLDVQELPAGIYMLAFEQAGSLITRKVIISK
jgi:hypothetical protein